MSLIGLFIDDLRTDTPLTHTPTCHAAQEDRKLLDMEGGGGLMEASDDEDEFGEDEETLDSVRTSLSLSLSVIMS